jgi:hypothetical protein
VKARGADIFVKGHFWIDIYYKMFAKHRELRLIMFSMDGDGCEGVLRQAIAQYSWSSMTAFYCVFWSKFVKELH